MVLAEATLDLAASTKFWQRLPSFGSFCQIQIRLCQSLAEAAKSKFASAKLWQKLPKPDLLLPNVSRACENSFHLCENTNHAQRM